MKNFAEARGVLNRVINTFNGSGRSSIKELMETISCLEQQADLIREALELAEKIQSLNITDNGEY